MYRSWMVPFLNLNFVLRSGNNVLLFLKLLSLVSLLLFVSKLHAQSSPFDQLDLKSFSLENGLEVMVLPMPEQDTLSCAMLYGVGSAHDPQGLQGLTSLLERLSDAGSGSLDASVQELEALEHLDQLYSLFLKYDQEARDLLRLGENPTQELLQKRFQAEQDFLAQQEYCFTLVPAGSSFKERYQMGGVDAFKSWVDQDLTAYTLEAQPEELELFCKLEAARMDQCIFRNFYHQKDQELNRLQEAKQDTEYVFQTELNNSLWKSRAYRNPVLGTQEGIQAITRFQLFEYYHTYYVPNNARIMLVGKCDPGQVQELIQKYFGGLKRQPLPKELSEQEPKSFTEEKPFLQITDAGQDFVRLVYSDRPLSFKDSLVYEVLISLLAEPGDIRTKVLSSPEASFSGIYAHYRRGKLGSYFSLRLESQPGASRSLLLSHFFERLEEVLRDKAAFLESCALAFEQTKKRINDLCSQNVTTPQAALTFFISTWSFVWEPEDFFRWPEFLESIDPEAVFNQAEKLFQASDYLLVQSVKPEASKNYETIVLALQEARIKLEELQGTAEEGDENLKVELQRLIQLLEEKLRAFVVAKPDAK